MFVRRTGDQLWVNWRNEKGGAFLPSALVDNDFGQITGTPAAMVNPDGPIAGSLGTRGPALLDARGRRLRGRLRHRHLVPTAPS